MVLCVDTISSIFSFVLLSHWPVFLSVDPPNFFISHHPQQDRQAVSQQPSMRHQRSFSAFGFGAGGGTGTLTSLSSQSRRGSQINVNVTPSQTTDGAGDTPEIRKYKKRFGSDILCAALWGKGLKTLKVMRRYIIFAKLLA